MCTTSGYDRLYAKSTSGLSQLLCMLFALSGALSVCLSSAPLSNFRGAIYICVMACACLSSAFIFFVHFCGLRHFSRFHCNATKYEMCINATFAATCFFVSSAALTLDLVAYTIAAFFGYVSFCLYALEARTKYVRYRQRDMSTQT